MGAELGKTRISEEVKASALPSVQAPAACQGLDHPHCVGGASGTKATSQEGSEQGLPFASVLLGRETEQTPLNPSILLST